MDVLHTRCMENVYAQNLITILDKPIAQMGANKPSPTCD